MAAKRWEKILDKVLALDYDTETEGDGMEEHAAHVLSMNSEAKEYFFSWWNEKVERINRIEDDADVDSPGDETYRLTWHGWLLIIQVPVGIASDVKPPAVCGSGSR